jgi:hypothetical protein
MSMGVPMPEGESQMKLLGYNRIEVQLSETETKNRTKNLKSLMSKYYDNKFQEPCADCKACQRVYGRSYCRHCENTNNYRRKMKL